MSTESGAARMRAPRERPSGAGRLGIVVRVATVTLFAVVPALTLGTMLAVGWSDDSLAADFHHEIYPQAKELLAGRNPYPPPEFHVVGSNFIWPPLVAYGLAPLTLLPATAADLLMVALGLVCFALSLWLLGVRDWRVYGVVAMWPEVASEMRVAHLTAPICLLVVIAWRSRDAGLRAPLAVGLATALKFFVWPVGIWLAARRGLGTAALAACVVGASLLLLLPITPIDDYVRSLIQLGRGFDQDSYTLFGLLVQSGASEAAGRAAAVIVGTALLVATWRYRSLALAVAAALTLSPIVWLDYFSLAMIPLAIARPRLSPVWLLPLATWGMSGAGLGIGDAADIARLLLVFSVVFAVAFHGEPERARRAAPAIP